MTKTTPLLYATLILLFTACSPTKRTTLAPPPLAQKQLAKFSFGTPSIAKVGSTGLTIALVKPSYVSKEYTQHPEYLVAPFNDMAESMGNDFNELLTSKGFTIRGPFNSRDEMTYETKINSNFILEVQIQLSPGFNRFKTTSAHSPSFAELMLDKNAVTTYTNKMNGEVTFGVSLVIKAESAQYGELLWTKSIKLDPSSFTYNGQIAWTGEPTMVEELNKDALVYNTFSRELEKIYTKVLNLAWQQIDPLEMKTIAEQSKKADKRGN